MVVVIDVVVVGGDRVDVVIACVVGVCDVGVVGGDRVVGVVVVMVLVALLSYSMLTLRFCLDWCSCRGC